MIITILKALDGEWGIDSRDAGCCPVLKEFSGGVQRWIEFKEMVMREKGVLGGENSTSKGMGSD